LSDGRVVLLSDTVGFVQRLPHHLVASFHATLEEALNVELLLHVVDASHPDAAAQVRAVDETLAGLTRRKADFLVLNKLDLVAERLALQPLASGRPEEVVLVSARSGEGLDRLDGLVRERIDRRSPVVEVRVSTCDGRAIAQLKAAGTVLNQRVSDGAERADSELVLTLRLLDGALGQLQSTLGSRAHFQVLQSAAEPFLREA
jgi:GTP-binding protein HflX